jgi:hypothetical protein
MEKFLRGIVNFGNVQISIKGLPILSDLLPEGTKYSVEQLREGIGYL